MAGCKEFSHTVELIYMSAQPVPRLTPEQYLEIDRAAEVKSEYYDGEMFAMSGGRAPHAIISFALGAALIPALRGRRCIVTGSDLRVRASEGGPFFYPDVSVCCGEMQLADDNKDTLLNPIVIFEVLSPSSEAYDRGKKFAAYRRIDSLREYVLVSQTEPSVESYLRGSDDKWTLTEFTGTDAICSLKSIECQIALSDVYRDVPA
jgi:Uma2 family endonuclease